LILLKTKKMIGLCTICIALQVTFGSVSRERLINNERIGYSAEVDNTIAGNANALELRDMKEQIYASHQLRALVRTRVPRDDRSI
jgi:hypothetical protein